MTKSSISRRADLKAAAKQFKKGETISLEDVALLWGVSKARFINVRNGIHDFPDPIGKQGNALLYDAKPVLDCLIGYEARNDSANTAKSAKIARILGSSAPDEEGALPASEMLALARTGAEIEKRKREQKLLVPFAEVQTIAAEVFGRISQALGKLSDSVDPNGRLPAPTRISLDSLGKDLLLRVYADLNDMLGGDADHNPSRAKAPRGGPNRPRRRKAPSKPA